MPSALWCLRAVGVESSWWGQSYIRSSRYRSSILYCPTPASPGSRSRSVVRGGSNHGDVELASAAGDEWTGAVRSHTRGLFYIHLKISKKNKWVTQNSWSGISISRHCLWWRRSPPVLRVCQEVCVLLVLSVDRVFDVCLDFNPLWYWPRSLHINRIVVKNVRLGSSLHLNRTDRGLINNSCHHH